MNINCLNDYKAVIVPIKNDVIHYKLTMIGQYTNKITNGRPVYILIDQMADQYAVIFIGTKKNSMNIPQKKF